MRVRLSFARAILCRPRLLFLDEPTTGLDPLSARRIKDLILKHRDRGATVFLTTHDMATADEICDRVAFLVDGKIIERIRTRIHEMKPTDQVEVKVLREGKIIDLSIARGTW